MPSRARAPPARRSASAPRAGRVTTRSRRRGPRPRRRARCARDGCVRGRAAAPPRRRTRPTTTSGRSGTTARASLRSGSIVGPDPVGEVLDRRGDQAVAADDDEEEGRHPATAGADRLDDREDHRQHRDDAGLAEGRERLEHVVRERRAVRRPPVRRPRVHAEPRLGVAHEQGQDGQHEPAAGEHDEREAERQSGGRLGVETGREPQPWRAAHGHPAAAGGPPRTPRGRRRPTEMMTRAMRGMGMRGSAQR